MVPEEKFVENDNNENEYLFTKMECQNGACPSIFSHQAAEDCLV